MIRKVSLVKVCTIMEEVAKAKIDSPELAEQFWHSNIVTTPTFDDHKEHCVVLLLNTRYNLVGWNLVSVGSLNESIVHPRDVFRPAIVGGAFAIILMHNHPSGEASPSQSDHSLTRRLSEAAELLQIKVLDHVIVGKAEEGRAGYFSFKEAGVL